MWIAFDMDGTLFDCGEIIVESYRRALPLFAAETGVELALPSRERICSALGGTADRFFGKIFPDLDPSFIPVLDRFCTKALVDDICSGAGYLYDRVPESLAGLYRNGHNLVIASNGQFDYITAILESRGLSRYLAAPVQTVDYKEVLTKGDILSRYRRELAIEDPFIMVGDRFSDLSAARHAGAYFIGCAFGHAGDSEIRGADFIAHSFDDIVAHIASF
jgi:phosphoglycolate phosphatase-like HAD superfamily hydrolase